MEPEVRTFLMKILWTLFLIMTWMLINILVGIKWGYGLIEPGHTAGTTLFYVWIAASVAVGFRLFRKHWGEGI
jgi:hypothetical protein